MSASRAAREALDDDAELEPLEDVLGDAAKGWTVLVEGRLGPEMASGEDQEC